MTQGSSTRRRDLPLPLEPPGIADSPGNVVLALARYWHDAAHAIAAVEEKHPGRCHRVRYEDMVHDPERIAAAVFDFIGVERMPGIAQVVFSHEHERFGPADHKIWHTSKISSDSTGRSDSVPAGLIPPPILEAGNGLLDRLGYVRVDEKWGTADMPAGSGGFPDRRRLRRPVASAHGGNLHGRRSPAAQRRLGPVACQSRHAHAHQ